MCWVFLLLLFGKILPTQSGNIFILFIQKNLKKNKLAFTAVVWADSGKAGGGFSDANHEAK